MEEKKNIFSQLPGKEKFAPFLEEMNFAEYLELCSKNPEITRTSYKRIYDMIMSHGTRKYSKFKEDVIHYNFFDDLVFSGKKSLFGLDRHLMKLVGFFKSASLKRGHERRVLLLVGPVASGKSTILELLKKGLEDYSKKEEGRLYSTIWTVEPNDEDGKNILGTVTKYENYRARCPLHEEPLRLLPTDQGIRENVLAHLGLKGKIEIDGDACPLCRYYFQRFLERYNGDWHRALQDHIKVRRLILCEKDRVGIGTFQPVDEKNQDSTELTGDINYKKLAELGAEDDPRVFNFRYGEFIVANRGLLEFKEVLKLDDAFLYPLLEASQAHLVKPRGFSSIEVDEIIIGHTNEPEYKKLQKNERMEAFKDRTIAIDIPNMVTLSDEVRIYERDYSPKQITDIHTNSPHNFEMLSMWMVATRIKEPKKQGLTLVQKILLYDGKILPGFSEETVKELKREPEAEREGLEGLSPRYAQNAIANLLVKESVRCLNAFMLFGEEGALMAGLHEHNPLISDKSKIEKYKNLLSVIKQEFQERVQADVQKAIIADTEAVKTLFSNYMDEVAAFVESEKVRDKFGEKREPDELLMRGVEEKIEPSIPESRKEDFRRQIMAKVGTLARESRKFEWDTDERLRKGLEKKLYEERKHTIKLDSLVSSVMDDETRKKIDVVKTFMIEKLGYCEVCAKDALEFVAGIWAKGGKTQAK